MNSKGPKHEPWGTPQFKSKGRERTPCTETRWLLSDKYDLNQFRAVPRMPTSSDSLSKSIRWSTVHKLWSWTSLENFYIYAWPFKHCLCFSNAHKNCKAVKIHLYKYWWGRGNQGGWGPCTSLLTPDTHSSTQDRCKTTLRCQLPYIPPPFFKVKSLKYPSEKAWFNGIY